MPTIIERLGVVNAASAGLPIITLPDVERQIFAEPSVTRWWRADAGWADNKWHCRKTDLALTKSGAGAVARSVSPAFNNREILTLAGVSDLRNTDGVALPTGGPMSVLLVGRPGPNSNVFMVNTSDAVQTTGLLHNAADEPGSNGGSVWYVNAGTTNRINFGTEGNRYAQGPFCYLISQDTVAGKFTTKVWRPGAVINAREAVNADGGSATVANTFPNLYIGNLGVGEQIAEVVIFNGALHLNPTLRSLVETYLLARYSLGPSGE